MYKKIFTVLFLLTIPVLAHADDRNKATHPVAPQTNVTPCAPGVVYVQFKTGSAVVPQITSKGAIAQSAGSNKFQAAMTKLGLRTIQPFDAHAVRDSLSRSLGIDRIYCLYYSNRNIDPHTALAMLVGSGEVECGMVRYIFPVSKTTNDPYLNQEYGLANMNVFNAWNTTTGDTSIVIADVDCGVNIDHEDLKNEVKINWGEIGKDGNGNQKTGNGIDDDSDGYIDNFEGWDFVGNVNASAGDIFQPSNDPRPSSGSHGTHTSGCILAQGNNGVGIAGVAFGCRLMPIKVSGADAGITAGPEGIHYASTHGARIINCSFGGLVANSDTALENLFLREARFRGALVVASAGNGVNDNGVPTSNDATPEYPANGPFVLSVGATDQNDLPAGFSNYGRSVSVWAPGVGIWSCHWPGNSAYFPEDGTSFACPYTAGAAGLLWSVHPDWLPQFIANQLIATCDNVVNPSDRNEYWGRINVGNALSAGSIGPGLIISGFSIDGVVSDSLKLGGSHDLKVTFKNVLGDGSNLSATPISSVGATFPASGASLGSMNGSTTATGDFQITRTAIFSEGNLPVQFAVTDGSGYADTLLVYIPLSRTPGFVMERAGNSGASIKRLSNSVAWAAFGQTTTSTSGALIVLGADYARESGGAWGDTTTLDDGSTAPYDVEAIDSLTAWFGTGQSSAGSVVYTTDGGQSFSSVYVSSFTPFVDGIHFFDKLNGVLIGDPKSSHWGIGVTADGGQTWNKLAKPIAAAGSVEGWNNSISWAGNYGWFGTNAKQILRTTDRGQTWKSVTTKFQHSLSLAFSDDAAVGIACFRPATTSSGGAATGTTGIQLSLDSGASWNSVIQLPVTGATPGSVQFVPKTHIAILTTDVGVYRTTDSGATWSPIGIPVSYTSDGADVSASRGNGKFVVSIISANNGVATYSEAMPDDTTGKDTTTNAGVSQTASSKLSFDISPNPSHSAATISFVLPESDHVRITITDALGRNVETVTDELLSAGQHQIALDERDLADGTYYATIETLSGIHLTHTITVQR